jgi:nifR3 family TIM-barrel protein
MIDSVLAAYKSPVNRGVPLASANEFAPLSVGSIRVSPPVVLAPMAGVTNYPFRSLCRSFGAGLYVSEMICARPLADGRKKTLRLADFGPDESPRSLQLYGVDPVYVREAVLRLVGDGRVDHLDMNFGCPVRKVTRRGGGAAIPLRPKLLASIVRAAVGAAGEVPVTIKVRKGIDEERLTFLDAGRVAQEEGCTAVGLHARTAADLYDGEADWAAIGELKSRISIPVLGNGDIQEAYDALRMMRETGCDGVIVGRGCLGRPWLFRDLSDVFAGREPEDPPGLGEVLDVMFSHLRRLVGWFGESQAIPSFRRHLAWYTKGFALSRDIRVGMVQAQSLGELETVFGPADRTQTFPSSAMRVRRGKRSGRQRVVLPETFLDAPAGDLETAQEVLVSGG